MRIFAEHLNSLLLKTLDWTKLRRVCISCALVFLFIVSLFKMELAHSLLLNEEALGRIAESKRSVFIFEWLRFLDKVLVAAQKVSTVEAM